MAVGVEIPRQVQRLAHVSGEQGRQAFVLLLQLQVEQAGFNGLRAVGWQPQTGQNGFQHRLRNPLRLAVGINPVNGQSGSAGEYFQLRFAHWRAPLKAGEWLSNVVQIRVLRC